jgi:MFS family permease
MASSPEIREQPGMLAGGKRLTAITPQTDRFNGWIYVLSYVLIFLSGPVDYVGAVQASLCDKLGSNHTVANLPAAIYTLGYIVPFLLASKIPYRIERTVAVVASLLTAASMGIVCLALFLPFGNTVRVTAVILQGVIMGVSNCTNDVYMLQCLGRGTTEKGRAWALKYTFALGPILGIVGSMGTQFVLNGGIRRLPFPYDFGLVYLVAIPCMTGVAILSSRYKMVRIEEVKRPPLFRSMLKNVRAYVADRNLVLLWLAFFFWWVSMSDRGNLSLYAQEAMHRSPATLAGLSMALRFSGKCMGGFALGALAARWGSFAPSRLAIILAGGALAWAWATHGSPYLFAFILVGAGELGGAYIPNSILSLSSPESGARNLSLLAMAGPVSSFAPVVAGAIADRFGFHASFAFGIAGALAALWLMKQIRRPVPRADSIPET